MLELTGHGTGHCPARSIVFFCFERELSEIIRKFAENLGYMDIKRYKDIVYKVIGAAMTVHKELGGGLLEPLYNEALCIELSDMGFHPESEKNLLCYYKGRQMKKSYRMDIVVDDVILELKSTSEICPEHRFQLFNYLRLTKNPIGLLINFGSESLECERYCYDSTTNECRLIDRNMNIVPR